MKAHRRTVAERLLSSSMPEPNSGCWLWLGGRIAFGYGRMHVAGSGHFGRRVVAHRVSYAEFVGPIPNGRMVLHRCDNPPCVNPAHLFLGTALDNSRDKNQKGRARLKYGEEWVRAARYGLARGLSQSRTGRVIGATAGFVQSIADGRRPSPHGREIVLDDPQLIALIDQEVQFSNA